MMNCDDGHVWPEKKVGYMDKYGCGSNRVWKISPYVLLDGVVL